MKVLGTDLSGATRVSFNGKKAAFKIISPTEIHTHVPSGTTTGKIEVVTPKGTLSGNVVFQVLWRGTAIGRSARGGWSPASGGSHLFWRNIASLTMPDCVKSFLSVLARALERERHFALIEEVPCQPRLAP